MDINFPQAIIGALFGAALGWFLGRAQRKKQIEEIKKSSENEIEEIRKTGLYPITNGLTGFEDKICDSISNANHSVQLCLSTPLLHSLKERWTKYDANQINTHATDHWALKFCEPLRARLRGRCIDNNKMRVEIVYLDDKILNKFVSEVPSVPISWVEYKDSIDHFFAMLKTDGHALPTPMCDLFVTQVPDVPIYMAIIDGPQNDGACPNTAKGFVGFMSSGELLAQRKSGREAVDIAANLQAYSFTNPEVIQFFSRLFRDVSLHGDQLLLQFLQQCQRGQYSWALVTDAIAGHGATPMPYATLLQPNGTAPTVVAPLGIGSGE